jgi:hypothetical protein
MRLAGQQARERTMNATYSITEPRKLIQDALKHYEDSRGWKWPVRAITLADGELAHEFAAAMDFYYGGHEMVTGYDASGAAVWIVGSKGYYHYVGA